MIITFSDELRKVPKGSTHPWVNALNWLSLPKEWKKGELKWIEIMPIVEYEAKPYLTIEINEEDYIAINKILGKDR